MTRKTLTKSQIFKIKGNGKKQRFSLGNKLFLFVQPSGKLSYRYCYISPITKLHKVKAIGDPLVMDLSEALSLALSYNAILKKGIDPIEQAQSKEEKAQLEKITLEEIAQDWQQVKGQRLSPKHLRDRLSRFKNHLFSILGRFPIAEIELFNARELIKPIYDKFPHMGEKVARDLRELGDHAVEMGILKSNHLNLIKKSFPRPKAKHNPCIKSEELPQFFKKLQYSNIHFQTRFFIEFLLLTMVRANELAQAEWTEIDFKNERWDIPAEKMKMNKPHSVPLSKQALEILFEMRKFSGNGRFIFPHRETPNKHCSANTANQAFYRALGYKDKMTPHGMRSLARTYLADKGVSFEVAEACLSHETGGSVAKAYNRSSYFEQRIAVMQMWGDFVEQCK